MSTNIPPPPTPLMILPSPPVLPPGTDSLVTTDSRKPFPQGASPPPETVQRLDVLWCILWLYFGVGGHRYPPPLALSPPSPQPEGGAYSSCPHPSIVVCLSAGGTPDGEISSETSRLAGSWPISLIQIGASSETPPCRIYLKYFYSRPPNPKYGMAGLTSSGPSKYWTSLLASCCPRLISPPLGIWDMIPLLEISHRPWTPYLPPPAPPLFPIPGASTPNPSCIGPWWGGSCLALPTERSYWTWCSRDGVFPLLQDN